jgi:hypothetical protein
MDDAEATLSLLGRLSRRGEGDVRLAARAARGEQLTPEQEERLVRAGVLRSRRRRSRLAPALIAPLLALDDALARTSRRLLSQLGRRLGRARSASERDVVLRALEEELLGQREALAERPAADEAAELLQLLGGLRDSVIKLEADQADPAQATRVAALAAELIEALAKSLTPRRQRQRKTDALPAASVADLCAALADAGVVLARPLALPSAEALAAALLPAQLEPSASVASALAVEATVTASVRALAGEPEPSVALYGGIELETALARHAAVAELGAAFLDDAGWRPQPGLAAGPEPLASSSALQATASLAEVG